MPCLLFHRTARRMLHFLVRRRSRMLFAVFATALLLSTLLTWRSGWPVPLITDEFAYLLAGDTFASGRLANPPHPFWKHFQTGQVLQQPTYASMYPPAQGLFLALGQKLFFHPIVGVWISAAGACAAICWVLQALLPRNWALVGGAVAIFRIVCCGGGESAAVGNEGYWSQSYWGGSVAALGGALLLGGLSRVRAGQFKDAVLAGIGVVLLANSRPFEGVIATGIGLGGVAGLAWGRPYYASREMLRKVGIVFLVTLACGAVATGYYNLRVTGDPLTLPYQAYMSLNGTPSNLSWSDSLPPTTDNPGHYELRWAMLQIREQYRTQLVSSLAQRVVDLLRFFLGRVLAVVCFVALPKLLSDRRSRAALCALAIFFIASIPNIIVLPHYAAPTAAFFVFVATQALRYLYAWRPPWCRWLGPGACALVIIACMIQIVLRIVFPIPQETIQSRIAAKLSGAGGKHLIIVQRPKDTIRLYGVTVYNAADIDQATIVWANDLGPTENQRLLDYFGDRQAWRARAGTEETRIEPYSE